MYFANYLHDGSPEKRVLFVQNQLNTKEELTLILPAFDEAEIRNILNALDGLQWKSVVASASCLSQLLIRASITEPYITACKTLTGFPLVGDKALADFLPNVISDADTYPIEEFTLAYWVEGVIKKIRTLRERGLSDEEILANNSLRFLFN